MIATYLTDVLREAILRDGIEALRGGGLMIELDSVIFEASDSAATVSVWIVDDKNRKLARLADKVRLRIGDALTLLDLDQAFKVGFK